MTPIESIRESVAAGKLLVITGAGVSLALASEATPSLNWPSLIQSAFDFASKKGVLDDGAYSRYKLAIASGDVDEMISAATFATRKLGGQSGVLYSDWLQSIFANQKCKNGPMKQAILALVKSNVPIATLNYDHLLEKATRLPSLSLDDPRKVMEWARREHSAVLHMHGAWDYPQTIILAMEEYSSAIRDDFRNNLQRGLTSFNRVLFVGCGDTFSDPNISSLITWIKAVVGAGALKHYALVPNSQVSEQHKNQLWHGFFDPVGYGDTYDSLPEFILNELALASAFRAALSKRQDKQIA